MSDDTILTVTDGSIVHCMTEGHLDTWWRSLSPREKAGVFEAALEGTIDAPPSLPALDVKKFQAHVDQFLADMERLHKSPLAGLVPITRKEVRDAAL